MDQKREQELSEFQEQIQEELQREVQKAEGTVDQSQKKIIWIVIGVLCVVSLVLFLVLHLLSGQEAGPAPDDGSTEQESQTEYEEPENLVGADIGAMDDVGDPQIKEREDSGTGAEVKAEDIPKGSYETSGVTMGIDVSKWQGKIDWKKVADSGITFAMIRVGYRTTDTGVLCEDPYARYNLQEASKAGVKIGVYFFSTAITREEALEEAAWVTSFIAQYPITYPVVYNCEGFSSQSSRMYGVNSSKRTSYAKAFLDYVEDRGYTPMLYGPKNDLEDVSCWQMAGVEGNYKVWVAQYPSTPYPQTEKTSYGGQVDMWQYTSKGSVPGISGHVDLNVAYFGYSQTAAPKDDTPADEVQIQKDPEAGISFQSVNEQVTAKHTTNLRTAPTTKTGSEVVATIKNGDIVTRTGIGSNGWSRISYNGKTLYAVTSYLTYPKAEGESEGEQESSQTGVLAGITFQTVNEKVTAKIATNLRSEPSTNGGDTTVVVQLKNGEWVTRTGIGDNGWSRVEYNGQILYAVTSYLTTEAASESSATEQKPTASQPSVTFTEVNEQVTPKIEVNLRTEPTSSGGDATVVVLVKNGEVLHRTGVGSNGWSRIEYNGQTVYAITSYLMLAEGE